MTDPILSSPSTRWICCRTRISPSEPEVAREHNVSRQTARSALQALEREGFVIVRPRRGRVVRSNQRLHWHLSEFERPDHTVLTTSDAWETDIEGQGHDPTRQDLDVERISPPESIATRLNLDPRTDTVVVRRHVRYIEGARLGISTGTPVAEHVRTGSTAADKAVRVMISIVPGDTLILQYTIPT